MKVEEEKKVCRTGSVLTGEEEEGGDKQLQCYQYLPA